MTAKAATPSTKTGNATVKKSSLFRRWYSRPKRVNSRIRPLAMTNQKILAAAAYAKIAAAPRHAGAKRPRRAATAFTAAARVKTTPPSAAANAV